MSNSFTSFKSSIDCGHWEYPLDHAGRSYTLDTINYYFAMSHYDEFPDEWAYFETGYDVYGYFSSIAELGLEGDLSDENVFYGFLHSE